MIQDAINAKGGETSAKLAAPGEILPGPSTFGLHAPQ